MMEQSGQRAISEISIERLLSFGPERTNVELGALNVLIGPNGCGKSNFIEVIDLIRSCASDFGTPIKRGGGAIDWVWGKKFHQLGERSYFGVSSKSSGKLYHHSLHLMMERQSLGYPVFKIETEVIEPESSEISFTFFRSSSSRIPHEHLTEDGYAPNEAEDFDFAQSFASQVSRKTAPNPSMWAFSSLYQKIRIYRGPGFGREPVLRIPQATDQRRDYLEEDYSNLGLFLGFLAEDHVLKKTVIAALSDLYPDITDFGFSVAGNTIQPFLVERDLTIGANRLSEGTLRYLSLVAILCDPNPSPFICIEEPEMGLHPDMLPKLADLLIAASARTQLVVTTHSDILVDALSDVPESIVICEKVNGATTMRRLDPERMKVWLEKYKLGELWTSGEIGGNRW